MVPSRQGIFNFSNSRSSALHWGTRRLCPAIPAFIHMSDGKTGDLNVLDMLAFEAGALYVVDRGYLDFKRLHRRYALSGEAPREAKPGKPSGRPRRSGVA